jgi:ferric-dicitrate binding protein FerR (iron transport regulator)
MLQEAMPEDELLVEEWLNADAANRKYYEHFKLIWDESQTLAANITVDENEAWQKFKTRVQQPLTKESKPSKTVHFSLLRKLQIAAAVLLLAVGIWWMFNTINKSMAVAMISKQSFSNTIADTLSDGSIVTLNKNTELSYPSVFKSKTRTVKLKGEAFFKVTPDKAKPFIIDANSVTITVVGTAFNVKNYGSTTQVIVESGIVQVSSGSQTILLHKGEQVFIKNNAAPFERSIVKDSLYNYYRTKKIICNATPLPDVIATINEAYNAHIVLGDDAVKQLHLSTTFKDENLETVINIIRQTFDLRITQQGDSTILNHK